LSGGRYGAQYGPDITFLGVAPCTLDDPATHAEADLMVVGAPFDGGTRLFHDPAGPLLEGR
jgi:agmatinase